MKKYLITYGTLISMSIAGFLIKDYTGGIITGWSFTLFILILMGRRQAKAAIDRVDAHVKKVIVDNLN